MLRKVIRNYGETGVVLHRICNRYHYMYSGLGIVSTVELGSITNNSKVGVICEERTEKKLRVFNFHLKNLRKAIKT